MRSRASSSSNTSLSTNGITNEDLGISQSEGALGLTRSEELELGIDTVKQRIISCSNEEQRAILIEKLIELRTELQDLKSEPSERAIRRLGKGCQLASDQYFRLESRFTSYWKGTNFDYARKKLSPIVNSAWLQFGPVPMQFLASTVRCFCIENVLLHYLVGVSLGSKLIKFCWIENCWLYK